MKDQILIGRNPVVEAFDSGVELEKVYLNKELRGEVEVTIRKLCKEHEIPLSKVPASKINDMAGNRDHQGVVAFISAVEYQDLENILPFIYEKGETPLIIMLDGVSDVRNLGADRKSVV